MGVADYVYALGVCKSLGSYAVGVVNLCALYVC